MKPLTLAGVCSGIGGFDLGFVQAGFQVLWSCEIDPMARAVLQHRFPGTTHYTDLTNDELFSAPAPDVLAGGTPCQGFSLAGERRGLSDNRSNLCLRFVELANRFHGATVLWENVPGVLSMPDNAFGTFLAGLVGADTALLPSPCPTDGKPNKHWRKSGAGGLSPKWPSAGVVSGPRRTAAWRVLDAQYFGVAQRRARVFVVADPGTGSAPALLFELEGLRRDTPPRRETRESITKPFTTGPGGSSYTDLAPTMDCQAKNGPMQNQIGLGVLEHGSLSGIADYSANKPPLRAKGGDVGGGSEAIIAFGGNNTQKPIEITPALTCNRGNHSGDFEAGTLLVPPVTGTLLSGGKTAGSATCQDAENAMLIPEVLAFAENSRAEVRLEGGDGRTGALSGGGGKAGQGQPTIAIGFPERMGSTAHASTRNLSPALGAVNPTAVAIGSFQQNSMDGKGSVGFNPETEVLRPVKPQPDHQMLVTPYAVRRLTPRECERLQGFPDDWTSVDFKGKPMSDAARYRQLGNAVNVAVSRWLARRFQLFLQGGPRAPQLKKDPTS